MDKTDFLCYNGATFIGGRRNCMNDILYAGLRGFSCSDEKDVSTEWELLYCAGGGGRVEWDGGAFAVPEGGAAVIPPDTAFTLQADAEARFIGIRMAEPTVPFQTPVVILDDCRRFLGNAFEAALYHYQSDISQRASLLSVYGNLIVCYLMAYHAPRLRPRVVEEIQRDIVQNYADPGYQLDSCLRALPFNYDYLRKLFQREMGMTPHQFLNNLRLQVAAKTLLNPANGNLSMADIARLCGFREPLYFSRMFKKQYGVAPSFYAQKQGKV